MATQKLTKTFVENLKFSGKQDFFWDASLEGFGVCVGAKTKTFYVQTRQRQNGKSKRISVGRLSSAFSLEQARTEAKKILGDMLSGVDVQASRKPVKTFDVTFEQAFERMLNQRDLKEKTVNDYQNVMKKVMSQWMQKSILSFTKDDVSKIYVSIAYEKNKVGYANLWVRICKSIINFAISDYELIHDNPFSILSQSKKLKNLRPRTGYIKDTQFKAFFGACDLLENQDFADFHRFIILTGIRNYECLSMQWSRVDLVHRTYKLEDPKNGVDIELPLSNYLFDLLVKRYEKRSSNFVFPGTGKTGHLVEPKKSTYELVDLTNQLLKEENPKFHQDINFTVHDLRRTFMTTGHGLQIDGWTLKRLVNHVITDVSGGYIQIPLARLREPHTQISDFILSKAKII